VDVVPPRLPEGRPDPWSTVPKIVSDALWGSARRHHHGRHPVGRVHGHRVGRGRLHLRVPGDVPVYRDYKWSELPRLVHRVVKTVAMVMMLIGFSVAFGYMMALMQIPAKMTQFFLTISDNKYVFLFLVNILLLLLGTFMDLAPMLLICTPIFMPVIAKLGIDPVHFGMIMILNLGIGLITPPWDRRSSSGCAIGKVTMEQVSKELWPFYGAMCLALLLVTYIPAISLWLPSLMK
jgi:tripartite ATP-independent transporter DctM subunit